MWKEVPKEFGDFYMVSGNGDIKSIARDVYNPIHGKIKRKEKILKYSLNHKGYKIVGLYKDGKKTTMILHIVIAKTFLPNPENKPQVNHKNGIKTDNRVENLEWVSNLENIRHAFKNDIFLERDNNNKKPVSLSNNLMVIKFSSIKEASEYLGTSSGAIGNVLNGSRNSIKGYRAEYLKS